MRKALIVAASVLAVGLGGCRPSSDKPMHIQTQNAKPACSAGAGQVGRRVMRTAR